MKASQFPTPEMIKNAIDQINEKMDIKAINMNKNYSAKEGLLYCLDLLTKRLANPDNSYFIAETTEEWNEVNEIYRNQISGIKELKTVQGRSIAVLCVDWLNGKFKNPDFINVKIEMR